VWEDFVTNAMTITDTIPRVAPDETANVTEALRQKGNAPFIGIRIGGRTVCIKLEVFKKSMNRLKVVDAELVVADEKTGKVQGSYCPWTSSGGNSEWNSSKMCYEQKECVWSLGKPVEYSVVYALRVYAVGRGVKASRLFLAQNVRSYDNRKLIYEWRKAEAKKRERPKLGKVVKEIQKLERQLHKLPKLERPYNPAVLRESRMSPDEDAYVRQQEHLWHLQKDTRRKVMRLARRGNKDLTSTQLYWELAGIVAPEYVETEDSSTIRLAAMNSSEPIPPKVYVLAERPLTVTKWGELTAYARDRKQLGDIWDYLKRLWEFCGFAEKPERYSSRSLSESWGASRYSYWQHTKNAIHEIEWTIADLKSRGGGL
jgi:hypothetical protein